MDTGSALMGIGIAHGRQAVEAAKQAISSPLLRPADGARGVLMNITGGPDLGLFEVDAATEIVMQAADPDANIIWGAVINNDYEDTVQVTVIATGFDSTSSKRIASRRPQPLPPIEAQDILEVPVFLRRQKPIEKPRQN